MMPLAIGLGYSSAKETLLSLINSLKGTYPENSPNIHQLQANIFHAKAE